jgi:pentatricopeptide repeat protein
MISRERHQRYDLPEIRQLGFPISCIIINAFCKNRNTAAAKAFFHGVKILRLHKEICYK